MVRTQIQLTEEESEALKSEARNPPPAPSHE